MLQLQPARRADRRVSPTSTRQPARTSWRVTRTGRRPNHLLQRAMKTCPLLTGQSRCGRPRIDACPPQDLIAEKVSDPGDPGLVDERSLDRRPPGPQALVQLLR